MMPTLALSDAQHRESVRTAIGRAKFVKLAIGELNSLYRMAMHLTRDPDAAADLVQETFVRALRPGVRFNLGGRGIRPWLFKIMHNVFFSMNGSRRIAVVSMGDRDVVDERTSSNRREIVGDDLASMNWDVVDDRVRLAVDALPVEQRLVLLLWGVEGMKYRQIASLMGAPMGTIMSRLFRAREAMAQALGAVAAERGLTARAA
jgi:RNA polymerase sigma-70 factor (ECF subfamily)